MIREDTIEHVASLSRLELTKEEKKRYAEQLSAVLEYMKMLDEVDTTDVPETSQVTGLEDIVRDDQTTVSLAGVGDLKKSFSDTKGSELSVHAVFNK